MADPEEASPRHRTRWNSTIRVTEPKPIKRGPIKRTSGKPKRFKHRRNESYARWIRKCPCILAHLKACEGVIEGCHFKARSTGGDDVGNMFAACTKHHRIQHAIGIRSFQSMYGLDLATTCRNLAEGYADDDLAF